MDLILILQIIVLLGAIFVGIRLGGIGVGYAGGIGVVILGLCLGMKPGGIPWDVILIIMSVIAAISAMQLAGGLDYLVQKAEKILRSNPKQINFLAPTVTYFLTFLAGTGHTAFSMMPVIVEVAKEQNIKPSAPLSIAVVASQIAITASPVSAAVVYMTGVLEPLGWSYPTLILLWLVTTFAGCMVTAFIITKIRNLDLSSDPVYQERIAKGLIKPSVGAANKELLPGAKKSVAIFLAGVILVVLYATAISKEEGGEHFNSIMEMNVGDIKILNGENDSDILLVIKKDINADPYYLNDADITIRHELKDKEFENDINKFKKTLKLEENKYATNRFKVKKIEYLETTA